MITKEQAMTCREFKQTHAYKPRKGSNFPFNWIDSDLPADPLDKPAIWRANGKCQTWKRSPERFKLPIKHGLYNFGYITEENAHLFTIA